MRTRLFSLALGLFVLGALLAPPVSAVVVKKKDLEKLSAEHRQFLLDVEPLLSKEELSQFLGLAKDYQRDGYIERFWKARDPYPETARNEFRESWYARLEHVRETYPEPGDERAEIFLLNGPPPSVETRDCTTLVKPLEMWRYPETDQVPFEVSLLFFQRDRGGPYRVWRPSDGYSVLFEEPPDVLLSRCHSEAYNIPIPLVSAPRDPRAPSDDIPIECVMKILGRSCERTLVDTTIRDVLISTVIEERLSSFDVLLGRLERRPEPRQGEWLTNFAAYSTDLPEGAATFSAEVRLRFPGRRGARTVVEGLVSVPAAGVEALTLPERSSFDFLLSGEVLRGDELFESFRYKFDVPVEDVGAGGAIALPFQRLLRPGSYRLVTRLEDLHAHRFHRDERDLLVPDAAAEPAAEEVPPRSTGDGASDALLAGAEAALRGERRLSLVGPPGEGLEVGMVRFDARVTGGDLERVTFLLDGAPVLSKRRPPYSVELDLGRVPRPHTVRAVGYDEAGSEVVSDELALNAGEHRFSVRFVEPQGKGRFQGPVAARLEVTVPEGATLERVELYRGEALLATLYQEPWAQTVAVPAEPTYLRAVAYLTDGNSTEDVLFLNAPGELEEVDVQLVELYTSVLDASGRPLPGLPASAFTVVEDGVRQEVVRFAEVRDLPIHVAVLFDTSASMEERLAPARDAALQFLRQIVTPKDRAAFISFNDRPSLAVKFTNDTVSLATELAGLKAERTTALYDAVVFGLYYMSGVRGQRAVLLLSDGKDEASRFRFKEALEYARVSGVTLYAIGLDLPRTDLSSRHELRQLAEETGGRSFFVEDVSALPDIYRRIEQELRSRYLLVYQSSNVAGGRGFRTVEVGVDRPGAVAETLRGYYP